MEPKVYHLDDREVHQFGFYVSVVWNTREVTERQGNKRIVTTVRKGRPFIAFYWIRESDGKVWRDEDSTVAGGINAEQTEEVAQGLLAAAAYIRSLA